MSFKQWDSYQQTENHGINYWLNQGRTISTGGTSQKFARTSQQALNNVLLLHDMWFDKDCGLYVLGPWQREDNQGRSGNMVVGLHAGTPATIQDFIYKTLDRTPPASTAICKTGIGSPQNEHLFDSGGLLSALCGLLGYIEVKSGYNPFYDDGCISKQKTLDATFFQNISSFSVSLPYLRTGIKSPWYWYNYNISKTRGVPFPLPAIYGYASNNVRKYITRYPQLNLTTSDKRWYYNYGLLGLTEPQSFLYGYSKGRNYAILDSNYSIIESGQTEGDEINLIEQFFMDIIGSVWSNELRYAEPDDSNYQEYTASPSACLFNNDSDRMLNAGLGSPRYGSNNFADLGNYRGPQVYSYDWGSGGFNNVYRIQLWNGYYTGRSFMRGLFTNADLQGIIAAYMPPFDGIYSEAWDSNDMSYIYTDLMSTYGDTSNVPFTYLQMPWCITGGQTPEQSALDCINSIEVWKKQLWTASMITQAQEASRYWYDYFGGSSGGGDPTGYIGRHWNSVIFAS